ncbi:MAG: helix-turn-helix transcriptional regulator [Pseudonocardiales bacterium]|nr:helix-turn-helix transcriptional regulator [Pseudonocardiales bacterium]
MSQSSGPRSTYARGSGDPQLLTIGSGPPKERADAARNRARILQAAERLFTQHDLNAVSMDQIAAEAGVGKGTLFRRFGDKAGLAAALLDAREHELQHRIIAGPPPLGPDADPAERLVAFLTAYSEFLDTHLNLVHLSETASPGARYRIGAYRFWHQHTAILLRAARPDLAADADQLAHALLAALAADLRKALHNQGRDHDSARGVEVLAQLVLTGRIQLPGHGGRETRGNRSTHT